MSRERILIAEDEDDILYICNRILSSQGYRVIAVQDGLQAIEVAKEETFDLLLTDVKMPQLNGLETARRIKVLQPDIVCVVMTGFGTMDTVINALQLGIDEFLVKPFAPDMLLNAISNAIDRAYLRRENIRLRAFVPLFELNKTLMSTVARDELLHRVLHMARRETRADKAALLLLNKEGDQPTFFIDDNPDLEKMLGHDLALELARIPRQLVIPGREGTDLESLWADRFAEIEIPYAIVTPLLSKTGPLGTLIVIKNHPEEPFAASDDEMLAIFCDQAAIAIENAGLFKEIQQAYEELKELDRLKSEFINIAAHELRTPLAILIGHANLLQEEVDGSMGERVDVIVRSALRLRELIDDMLNLRHLETGEVRLNLEPANLKQVVKIIINDLEALASKKKQTIQVFIENDLPPVMVDYNRLHSVFSNLISNATKFTPKGGEISVRGWPDGDDVLLSVKDNGVGIPSAEIDRIFDRFYQVEDSLTRQHEGIGLGLAIVKSTVELWNGRVWAESQEGQGSTFIFSVPQAGVDS